MQLLIDAGNTRIKWAALEGGGFLQAGELQGDQPFGRLASELPAPAEVWVASVRDDAFSAALAESLRQYWPGAAQHWPVTRAEAFGVTCAYPEPETMGVDRWLALLAAHDLTPGPVCVVDAGSAVTLDALDPLGRHLGGLILPGMAMAREMMHQRTARVRVAGEFQRSWWTDNTSDALNNGSYWGIVSLVDRFREETVKRLGADCDLVLTGGDAPAIMESLQRPGRHEPQLVLKGLALIAGDSE